MVKGPSQKAWRVALQPGILENTRSPGLYLTSESVSVFRLILFELSEVVLKGS